MILEFFWIPETGNGTQHWELSACTTQPVAVERSVWILKRVLDQPTDIKDSCWEAIPQLPYEMVDFSTVRTKVNILFIDRNSKQNMLKKSCMPKFIPWYLCTVYLCTGDGYIHYYDWGPNSGANWMISRTANSELRSIESHNVEPGYSNSTMCLNNALESGFFQVFNGNTWVVDLTFKVLCI